MLEGLAADTGIIVYLMAGIGVLGILAKLINHVTLRRLVKAAGNMPKSTHRLIMLVRGKYEHACMIHDSVENIDAFVEKYICEYRGFLFRIHTWRQIEVLSVWFAGILATIGAWLEYNSFGMTETVYQYLAAGVGEMVLLSVIIRLSDEPYKVNAVKMYMADYLENICAFRLKKQSQREREREFIDVISSENGGKNVAQPAAEGQGRRTDSTVETTQGRTGRSALLKRRQGRSGEETGAGLRRQREGAMEASAFRDQAGAGDDSVFAPAGSVSDRAGVRASDSAGSGAVSGAGVRVSEREDQRISEELSINIEGEPRTVKKGDAARQPVHSAASENVSEEERTALKEEAIRQILEEFLA